MVRAESGFCIAPLRQAADDQQTGGAINLGRGPDQGSLSPFQQFATLGMSVLR